MDGCMDAWMDGWMRGSMDGWMAGWMDGANKSSVHLCVLDIVRCGLRGEQNRSVPLELPGPVDVIDSPEMLTVIGALKGPAKSWDSVQQRYLTWTGFLRAGMHPRQEPTQMGEPLMPGPTGCPDPQGIKTLLSM